MKDEKLYNRILVTRQGMDIKTQEWKKSPKKGEERGNKARAIKKSE